jgi:hypothetical protein
LVTVIRAVERDKTVLPCLWRLETAKQHEDDEEN